jgi:hypothetical protein
VRPDYRQLIPSLLAEVVFAMLPLLVVFVVLSVFHKYQRVLASPEWSFAAAILFGQAIVRFMTGFAHAGRAKPGPVALAVALVIVLGLTPSLMILSAILKADFGGPSPEEPEMWIQIVQVVLFVLSAGTYLTFGALGEIWRMRTERISTS